MEREGGKGRVKIHQSYKNPAKKSCRTQSPSDQIMPILRLVHASKMGDVVKTESLLFSRDHPLPRQWCFTSSWASCLASAACQVLLIVTLFWCVVFFFFSLFPAESEGAGCVLLHTSRKVSRDAVWPVWFFHHQEVQKRIMKHTEGLLVTGLSKRHLNASSLEFLSLSFNLNSHVLFVLQTISL